MTRLRSCWLISQALATASVVAAQNTTTFADIAGYTPGERLYVLNALLLLW